MKITTKRDLIRGIAQHWRQQYEPFEKYDNLPIYRADHPLKPIHIQLRPKRIIAEELDKLDPETATEDQVSKIIGNGSWTRLTCNECKRDVETIITVGEVPDIESHTADLCPDCIAQAARTIQAHLNQ